MCEGAYPLSSAPAVTERGSQSFARQTVYREMERGISASQMLLGPIKDLATKEQATPTWKKSRVQPKNFAFTAQKYGMQPVVLAVTMDQVQHACGKRSGVIALCDEGFSKKLSELAQMPEKPVL